MRNPVEVSSNKQCDKTKIDLQLYFPAISPSFPSLLLTALLFRSVSCFIFWLLLRWENKEAENLGLSKPWLVRIEED